MKKTLLTLLTFIGFAGVNHSVGQCSINDVTVTTSQTNFTCQGSTTVTIPTPQSGTSYYLMDSVSGNRVSDWFWDQGSPINIPTSTYSSSQTLYVIGEQNLPSVGLDFDGIDDYVEISPMITPTSDFTVEAWVNAGNLNGGIVFAWGSPTVGNYLSVTVSGASGFRKFKLFVGDGVSPQFQLTGTQTVDDGMWHHLAVVRTGNFGYALIVDGNIDATGTTTNITTPTALSIGGGFINNGWQGNFLGQIDEVRFWDFAKTDQDVQDEMYDCIDGTQIGLVAYYQMEDGAMSPTAADETGNGYTGTLNNMDASTDWIDGMSICGPVCTDSMSTLVHVNINPIADQTVAMATSEFCVGPANTTADLGSSETGVDYYLRDNSNNAIVDGPVAGNGGAISLATGSITSTTSYNVYANIENPSTGLYVNGGSIFPEGSSTTFTDFTMEAWYSDMATAAYTSDPCIMLTFDEVTGDPEDIVGVFANLTTGLPYIQHMTVSGGPSAPSTFGTTNILNAGSSHHIALVGNSSTGNYELFIDGVMETSVTGTIAPWYGSFVAAFDPLTFSEGSAIAIYDDLRFWDIARTGAQILADKDGCLFGGATNLIGYWPLDEGNGTVLGDMSGAGLSGPLSASGTEGVEFTWDTGVTTCLVCEQQMSQIVSVLIGDTLAPNVICQNITIQLDGNGDATITSADVDGGTFDNCDSSPTLSIDISAFSCSDISLPDTALIITGIYDGPLPLGTPKGIELHALANISDLSEYGIGSATNGGGTDGEEFTFPAVSLNAGDYIYISSESVEFSNFFGFAPDYTAFAVSVNGDDAIELFHNGSVIDVFGDINVDGTGQPWEYLDGWAYRNDNTGPDGTTFNINNWSFSGTNVFDGETSNSTAGTPAPIGTYAMGMGVPVTLTAIDADNNASSCVAMVNVIDVDPPTLTGCPTNISVNANTNNCGATVSWSAPTAADNCGIDTLYSSHQMTDVFPLGVTTVTYNAMDASGNTATCSFDVEVTNDMAATVLETDADCFAAETGSIDLTVTGGSGPFDYNWDNGDAVEDPTMLGNGTYNVIVTDQNGCTVAAFGNIGSPSAIAISSIFVDPTACQTADGSIDVSVSGGTVATDYTYNWSSGENTQDISTIAAGLYTIVVSDDNNCMDSVTIGLSDPNSPTITMVVVPTMLDCYGDANGSMEVLVALNGGATSYTVLWDNGSTFNVIPLLPASTHTVAITDDNNCVATSSGTITQPDSISGAAMVSNAMCFGDMNGAIDFAAIGGTESGLYGFSWAHGPTTEDVTGLAAGTYTVTVTDDNACQNSFTFEIFEADSLIANATVVDITCNNDNDGSVTLAPTGGDGNYSYLWDNAATSMSIAALAGGTYTVTITDGSGCTGGDTYTIVNPAVLSISGTTTTDSTGTSGGVDITVGGGTTPYGYSWDNSATTEDIVNVVGGTYNVTVTDANGCTISDTYVVASSVGINETTIFSNVYPNPTDGILIVELEINEFEVSILDLEGRIVSSENIHSSNKVELDLSSLARGVYVLQVKEGMNIHKVKIVKQ